MTKTEQRLFDSIRAYNDAGEGANDYRFVGRTKGKRLRYGHTSGEQKQNEVRALERLVQGGHVEERNGHYYVKDHPLLAAVAAQVNLLQMARYVDQRRKELEVAETMFEQQQAFVRRFWGAQ